MSEICTVNDESLARAVEIIHDGGLVVIPTDTVYGVACDPRNIEAIRKVFAAKQRPKYKSFFADSGSGRRLFTCHVAS